MYIIFDSSAIYFCEVILRNAHNMRNFSTVVFNPKYFPNSKYNFNIFYIVASSVGKNSKVLRRHNLDV